jgi:AcrR family transcriptional regulator
VPDPQSTKRRIFDAAVEEFAEHGSAGARVDRIALKAQANKESIYRYFGTKEDLLRRVIDQYLDERGEQLVPQARELPVYASDLLEFHARHPEFLRMSLWEALEFGDELDPGTVEHRRKHYEEKLASVAGQQRDGLIDPDLDPRHLLAVIFGMADYWSMLPQLVRLLFGREVTEEDMAVHREFVAECIRRIIMPRTDSAAAEPADST